MSHILIIKDEFDNGRILAVLEVPDNAPIEAVTKRLAKVAKKFQAALDRCETDDNADEPYLDEVLYQHKFKETHWTTLWWHEDLLEKKDGVGNWRKLA